jgi:hypothetical protein
MLEIVRKRRAGRVPSTIPAEVKVEVAEEPREPVTFAVNVTEEPREPRNVAVKVTLPRPPRRLRKPKGE